MSAARIEGSRLAEGCLCCRGDRDPALRNLPALELVRSGVALDPDTGTRLDAFSCVECGGAWLLAVTTDGKVVDWFRDDRTA